MAIRKLHARFCCGRLHDPDSPKETCGRRVEGCLVDLDQYLIAWNSGLMGRQK